MTADVLLVLIIGFAQVLGRQVSLDNLGKKGKKKEPSAVVVVNIIETFT